ncbi:MAG: phenylalanine--tRNA ligase subunit beta [Candidatus Aenigmatarchaeota archaeon]|nr:phenylalanine--tRNA ligase subunit beta [Candidatus Aenigmarchaeota archaeon]
MPTIKVNTREFCNFVGKNMSVDEIAERIPMLGVAWEGHTNDEFEVEVFPNRPDMLSVEGLARSFSSFLGFKKGLKKYSAEQSEYMITVDGSVSKVRPIIVSCVIKGLDFNDDLIKSVMQLQEKLMLTHGRKRKKVAIGLHDLDKINFPLTYTTVNDNVRFIPLEFNEEMSIKQILETHPKGKEYAHILQGSQNYPVIIDAVGRIISFPPIINSEHTKINENTKNIFVDITALDAKAAMEVLNIIATNLADRGGRIFRVKIKYPDSLIYTPDLSTREINVDLKYANKILGLNLDTEQAIEFLKRMGYDAIELRKDVLKVQIPCYRTDIMHEFDIVEDIAIAYGYENFDAEIPNISTIGGEDQLEAFATKIRSLLVGFGLQEVLTFILSNKNALFEKMNLKEQDIAETANSKTSEYNVVRNWLLPSMMDVLARNKHNDYPQNIFEVGDCVELASNDIGAATVKKMCIVLCHAKASFSEIKSIVESFMKNIGIEDYAIEEDNHDSFIPGRTAKLIIKGREIALFGEIHPIVLEKWGLEMPVAACEMNVNWLFEEIFK